MKKLALTIPHTSRMLICPGMFIGLELPTDLVLDLDPAIRAIMDCAFCKHKALNGSVFTFATYRGRYFLNNLRIFTLSVVWDKHSHTCNDVKISNLRRLKNKKSAAKLRKDLEEFHQATSPDQIGWD